MFINYAHRGASEYAPENTMSAFYLGIEMKADGIETDVRKTKDGVLVLFHDRTLQRVMNREGSISDYTYPELLQMRVKNENNGTEDIIVRFEDFLKYFGFRDLCFAIELKDGDIEDEVIDLLEKYSMREKTIITSAEFEYLANVKKINPAYRIGYLMKQTGEHELEQMRSIGGEQLCPRATYITKENVKEWHDLGYNVRTWGVVDVELMKHACACGVDGMTINFPDVLRDYIGRNM